MRLMNREAPMGVSMVKLVHMLAKQAENMEAYKLARFAYGKLQGLKVVQLFQTPSLPLQFTCLRAATLLQNEANSSTALGPGLARVDERHRPGHRFGPLQAVLGQG